MLTWFHGDFSQTEAVGPWKRLRDFEGGRQKRVWIASHLSGRRNPLILKGSTTFFSWRFPNKSVSLFLTPHHHHHPSALFLGKLLNQNRPRDRSFLCVELGPTLDSFTWCETLHGVLNLNIFYHNRIIPPPVSLPLFRLYFTCLFSWWGSKSGFIQVMAFYPYTN